jgi:hypothetical protein
LDVTGSAGKQHLTDQSEREASDKNHDPGASLAEPTQILKSGPLATAAAVSVPAATGPAARTFFPRPGEVDGQGASAQFLAIQGIDHLLSLFGRFHRDEGESARTAGAAVHHQLGLHNGAVCRESVLQVVFSDV